MVRLIAVPTACRTTNANRQPLEKQTGIDAGIKFNRLFVPARLRSPAPISNLTASMCPKKNGQGCLAGDGGSVTETSSLQTKCCEWK
jgi:hypothetical protein